MPTMSKRSVERWGSRRINRKHRASTPAAETLLQQLQPEERAACGVVCSFGAMRVGVLLERMGLHLHTQRFLAKLRGDRVWEASCDYAALAIERLGARLRPEAFAAELFPPVNHGATTLKKPRRGRARGGR